MEERGKREGVERKRERGKREKGGGRCREKDREKGRGGDSAAHKIDDTETIQCHEMRFSWCQTKTPVSQFRMLSVLIFS